MLPADASFNRIMPHGSAPFERPEIIGAVVRRDVTFYQVRLRARKEPQDQLKTTLAGNASDLTTTIEPLVLNKRFSDFDELRNALKSEGRDDFPRLFPSKVDVAGLLDAALSGILHIVILHIVMLHIVILHIVIAYWAA
eukprot:SAG31_NODE_8132_length_1515_cov_1.117938_2_plen_139_part_00